MQVIICIKMNTIYTSYYLKQSGGGEIGNVYRSDYYGVQRGRGLGSILGGLIRILKPLFSRGLNAVKNQAIKTGTDILSDIGSKPIKDIIINRGQEAKKALTEKAIQKINAMSGDGIIYKESGIGDFIRTPSLNNTTSKKKRASIFRDIKTKLLGKNKKSKKKKKKGNNNKRINSTKSRTLDIFS